MCGLCSLVPVAVLIIADQLIAQLDDRCNFICISDALASLALMIETGDWQFRMLDSSQSIWSP